MPKRVDSTAHTMCTVHTNADCTTLSRRDTHLIFLKVKLGSDGGYPMIKRDRTVTRSNFIGRKPWINFTNKF